MFVSLSDVLQLNVAFVLSLTSSYRPVSFFVCQSLSLSLCPKVYSLVLSLCFPLRYFCPCLSACLCLFVSLSFFVCQSLSLSLCPKVYSKSVFSLTVFLSLSVCLSLFVFCLFVSLSPSHHHLTFSISL